MSKIQTLLAGVMLASVAAPATAGGILTNTNQSIDFLRNPARDAAIGLDGVYSNPAGVAFMPEGFHLGLNWQYARQTRTVTSTNPVFAIGHKNSGQTSKVFEGTADAPCIPSIQAAYNTGDWSWQFNFSVPGGGGACEFADGLGSFESVVGNIATQLQPFGARGYDMDGYMEGRQYYFGFQVGTAYKVNDRLSVYGGLRLLYGTATYKAKISNIMVNTGEGTYTNFGSFLQYAATTVDNNLELVNAGMARYEAAGATALPEYAALAAQKAQLEGAKGSFSSLQKYSQGVNLLCNQSSVGVAPVIGVDYKLNDQFNFAAKYEFKTQIRMKNESTVNEASEIQAVNKFRDGEKVNEDAPALLTVGAQWSPVSVVRINAGWHHFFDKQADWYGSAQEKLSHDSNEWLAGAEWDVTDRLTVSAGGQLTRYGLTDEYMNDMSFVVDSYSLGFGFNYKVSNVVTMKAGYFQTMYETYDRAVSPTVSDSFTRTNRVLGVGCDIDL
jgi:long-subunit fatty acid transport protein